MDKKIIDIFLLKLIYIKKCPKKEAIFSIYYVKTETRVSFNILNRYSSIRDPCQLRIG
jgi:hypothetical protein